MTFALKSIFNPLKKESISLEDFRELYIEHKDFVRNAIYWMIRNDSVDDLVQETFLKAYKSIEKFQNNSSFKTWIYRIAMNTVYDELRKNKTQKVEILIDKEHHDDNKGTKDLIDKAILDLSLDHREVFILFYKFGYSHEEIANMLKLKVGTIKSRIHYAKESFTHFLTKNGVSYE